jgi:HD superfamily phosphohydrolase/NAD-dependent SIR2 family protein deacetylase
MADMADSTEPLNKLLEQLVQIRARCQPIIAVVGSGVSAPQVPLMEDIIKYAIAKFKTRKYENDPVLVANPRLRTAEGIRELFQRDPDPVLRDAECWMKGVVPWLRRRELAAERKPSRQHHALMELLKMNLLRAIITTNWDCLLESAAESDRKKIADGCPGYVTVRDKEGLENWLQQPRALPALVKIHGDVREVRCSQGHVTVQGTSRARSPRFCPICSERTTARLLLPDSARRLSREMIDYFRGRSAQTSAKGALGEQYPAERFDRLGAILVIGFSGKFDRHLHSLISDWAKDGCLVAFLDLSPTHAFSGTELLVAGSASRIIPQIASRWKKETALRDERGANTDLVSIRAEERFDALFGRIPITELESRVLAHPEFSRLRNIKQLGQKSRFYTSADHSRFEHSVASLKVIDDLYVGLAAAVTRQRASEPITLAGYHPTADERQLVRLATLFHDFGHIWFSHLGEEVIDDLLESKDSAPFQLKQIRAEASGKHEGLVRIFLEHAERKIASKGKDAERALLSILRNAISEMGKRNGIDLEDFYALLAGKSRLGHLNCLVASSIDADKLEYLRRDSVRTGRGGGQSIGADAIAQAFEVTEFGRTTIQLDAMSSVERVAAERYLMFQSVYLDDRVRSLEESLIQVLIDYLSEELNSRSRSDVIDLLLRTEAKLLGDLKAEAEHRIEVLNEGGLAHARYDHWLRVLKLITGEGQYPSLELWLLYPSARIREQPLDDARQAIKRAFDGLRSDLGTLFHSRYKYSAVFALYKFSIHSGPEEVPISGGYGLYWPREVSPLIRGLQDARATPLRLSVLYFDSSIRRGCREEIDVVIARYSRDFEVRVNREITSGGNP